MKRLPAPNLENLRSELHYDPSSGIFTRLTGPHKGKAAGHLHHKGYITIMFHGSVYPANRLAWYYHYGEWPQQDVDHKDRVRSHNWIDNLRLATRKQNCQNRTKRANKKLPLGVFERAGRTKTTYFSVIHIDGKNRYLGTFPTVEAASAAYQEASINEYGPFSPFVQDS